MAIVTTPITTFDRATPNDGLLFGDEFSQLYANDIDLQSQIAAIAPPKGFIGGHLKFNSTSLPPRIASGDYEVNGQMVNIAADLDLDWTDVIGSSRRALTTYGWYLVGLESDGTPRIVWYGEGPISGATGNITSIVESPSGTYTLTKSSGTLATPTDKTIVITDGTDAIYTGKCTGGNGTDTAVFIAPAGLSFPITGTWTIFGRITTLHGTGSATEITTDADIEKYTPSLGENTTTSIAAWSDSLQGFYCNLLGYTGLRFIGAFNVGAANVSTTVISYKTGRDKNDNEALLRDINASPTTGSTDISVIRWNTITKCFGCDYTVVTTATAGTVITSKRDGFASISLTTSLINYYGINKNATQLTTEIDSMTDGSSLAYTIGLGAGAHNSISAITKMNSGDNIRSMTRNTITATASERNTFVYVLIL